MKAGHIKGALLEYSIRKILMSCGFINCQADGLYTFNSRGLLFINGKGAAHDADVFMEPPIQMPFAYPTRLIFECKAYGSDSKVSLPVIRNALGLRNDVNDFEIVTKNSLNDRKNSRRASYALENRKRYNYQVGIAAVNDFTKPSIEFAANNKIPLFSLSWFLGELPLNKFNSIDQELIDSIPEEVVKNVYNFLKDRSGKITDEKYTRARNYFMSDNIIGDIKTSLDVRNNTVYVGVLETGDMLFLYPRNVEALDEFPELNGYSNLEAEIHFNSDNPNIWQLSVHRQNNHTEIFEFEFFLPERILEYWGEYNLDKAKALDIKANFFSRIFLFNKNQNRISPFSIVTINENWLNDLRNN